MSDFETDVRFSSFGFAVGLSALLHGTAVAGLLLGVTRSGLTRVTSTPPIDFASVTTVIGSSGPATIPVEPLEAPTPPQVSAPARVELSSAIQPSPRDPDQTEEAAPSLVPRGEVKPPIPRERSGDPEQRALPMVRRAVKTPIDGRARDEVKPQSSTLSSAEAPPPAVAVDRESLHRAMAAATSASPATPNLAPPVIRVDPREKNLDRAFSRAFAWAFAVERDFFSAVPIGRARFTLELAEDGHIDAISWSNESAPPARLRQLVERMVRLLSVNRFSPPMPDGESPWRREFLMTVTESRVAVPESSLMEGAKAGDLWMLEAGETPTIGRPSHPSVADATGRRIRCTLEIVASR